MTAHDPSAGFLASCSSLLGKVLNLAVPYGCSKMIKVLAFALGQGFFQVLGVSSIFPFLALVSDTHQFRTSPAGSALLRHLPMMDDASLLWWAGLLSVALLFISNVVNIAAEFNRSTYSLGFAHWLRVGMLRRVASRSYANFLSGDSNAIINKLNVDVMQYATGVLLPLLDCIGNLTSAALIFGTIAWVNPAIALSALVLFGLYYIFAFVLLTSRRKAMSRGLNQSGRGASHALRQLLDGIKPIKVHLVEEAWITRFAHFSKEQSDLSARLPVYQNGPRYLMELLAFGGLVLVVLLSMRGGRSFTMILPNLGVVALAGYRLLPSVQIVYSKLTHISTMRHTLDEVYREFTSFAKMPGDEGPRDEELFSQPPPMLWNREIRIEKLSFHYPEQNRRLIDGLSLLIPKNSSLGITGASGCGKSSLVDLILGLQTPTSGQVYCDDVPLQPTNRRSWSRGIGYVPQEVFLIDDTVAANIAFGVPPEQVDPAALRKAAEASKILYFIESELANGFQHLVGERGVRLSGGQRQRIGLARALYHQPSLLILDEATSALDLHTESEVLQAIHIIQGTVTLIMISHRMSAIAMCDQVLDFTIGGMRPPEASENSP